MSRRLSILSWLLVAVSATAIFAAQPPAKSARKAPAKRADNPAFAPVTDDPKLPRVMLIGDSISIGYTLSVREALAGKANVHRPADNCGPTTRGLERLDQWLGNGRWDLIHFNWGLHDLRNADGKPQVALPDYEKNLTELVARLKRTGAKLVWCSTTPVPEGCQPMRLPEDVPRYNAVAAKIMQANQIPIDDLYSFALPRLAQIQLPKNVHFTPDGSKVLGTEVARQIEKYLPSK